MQNFEYCKPVAAKTVPAGPNWIHEVKYDGYRMRVERNGKSVRLFSKGGTDWTKRYPWVVETALKIKHDHFIVDGEAVILGVDGISDFNALHSRHNDHEVQLYAFDCLSYGGDDLRRLPLAMRKTNLMQLLRGRSQGIFVALTRSVKSALSCLRLLAAWGWRDWFQNTGSAPTVGVAVIAGSRSRTAGIQPTPA
jgi:bifunctional non-homologous end joining protein LigD